VIDGLQHTAFQVILLAVLAEHEAKRISEWVLPRLKRLALLSTE
jgi:hypothetical protein